MYFLSIAFVTALVGMPICLATAWWFWLRADGPAKSGPRSTAAFVGLLAASADALIYYGWIPFILLMHESQTTTKIRHEQRMIGGFLVLAAILLAILGRGKLRIPLAICAILGFFLWIPAAVL